MYPILFRADVWDEEIRHDYGVIMATGYIDGMEQIEKYYGYDLCGVELFMCEEGPLMIDEELYNQIKTKTY
jgi:hypothetical protein